MKRIFTLLFVLALMGCAQANPLNTFAGQTGSIPLSQLDTNFATVDCGKYNVNQASTDQGVADSTGTIKDYINAIGSNKATICLTTAGTYTITTSIAMPSNITLNVRPGQ